MLSKQSKMRVLIEKKKASHEVLHWSDTHIVLEWINQAHERPISRKSDGTTESDRYIYISIYGMCVCV